MVVRKILDKAAKHRREAIVIARGSIVIDFTKDVVTSYRDLQLDPY
jgi:hypothetical protein